MWERGEVKLLIFTNPPEDYCKEKKNRALIVFEGY